LKDDKHLINIFIVIKINDIHIYKDLINISILINAGLKVMILTFIFYFYFLKLFTFSSI